MTRDDPELGSVRLCDKCGEWWPDDNEFWPPSRRACRACIYEGRAPYNQGVRYNSQVEREEARRRTWRAAYYRRCARVSA
jgi:hypothetical protein